MTATSVAQGLGPRRRVVYRYTFDVTEISGEPIGIDIPTNYVDAPDESATVDSAPADTIPVATP